MQDGRDAAEVLEALKKEVVKLQDDPIVLSISGPELMAVAEDCGAVNLVTCCPLVLHTRMGMHDCMTL